MKKYGCLNKLTNITEYEYTSERQKSLSGIYGKEPYVQYEIQEGKKSDMYTWNSSTEQVELSNDYEVVNPNTLKVKIYRYVTDVSDYNVFHAPIDLNYNTGLTTTLFAKRLFNQGELQRVEWHSTDELNDIILSVDIVYQRDSVGFATRRTTTRTWYKENGEEALPKKITEKVYSIDPISQIEEGERRRGNLVKSLQMPIIGFLLSTIPPKDGETEIERSSRIILLGRKFLRDNKEYFTAFIEDSNREVSEIIANSTDFWMDNIIDEENGTTIRDYLLNQLDIGGVS